MAAAPNLSDYITVPERISQFRDLYPDGCLRPVDPGKPYDIAILGDKTFIVYAAAAYRREDDTRPGIGVAWEPFPGRTPYTKDSELMNAETSAWGRAIVAVLAADTKSGIASREEVEARSGSAEGHAEGRSRRAPSEDARKAVKAAESAQAFAELAGKSESVDALRAVWMQAGSKGKIQDEIAHPSSGEKMTLQKYLEERGTELQFPAGAESADPDPGASGSGQS